MPDWRLYRDSPPYKTMRGITFVHQEILMRDWWIVQFMKLAGSGLILFGLLIMLADWSIFGPGLILCGTGANTILVGRLWWYGRRYYFKRIQRRNHP